MINQTLHRKAVPLDRSKHRGLRMQLPVTDWSIAATLNSMLIPAAEFVDTCREYPVVFVPAGADTEGKAQFAPIAVFGLAPNENLFVDGANWRAYYIPVFLRLYPFGMGRVEGDTFAVCFDESWAGVSQTNGVALFGDDGLPSETTKAVQAQLEQAEIEIQRTRLVGEKLNELELLRPMRFDATMPNGEALKVEGFLTVDEEKLKALSDAAVLDLQRTGILGLVHAHLMSLGNMRRLAEWRAQREEKARAANGAATAA